jgi:hypothetical protein
MVTLTTAFAAPNNVINIAAKDGSNAEDYSR